MKKLLIIEDDQSLLATVRNYFNIKGYEVEVAENGALGIQSAFAILPACIICDINIPVADGYVVFKILSEAASTSQIPFVFLTAKSSHEEIRKGMQLGADDYITKPFKLEDLFQAVETRIKKRDKIISQNEEKFRHLILNSPFPTFLCQNNKFAFVNQKMADLLKFSKEELSKRNLLDFMSVGRHELMEKMTENISGEEKGFMLELQIVDRFGHNHLMLLSAASSFFNERACVVGNLIQIESKNSQQTQLTINDVKNIIEAIEAFDSQHKVVPHELVSKLYAIFKTGKEEFVDLAGLHGLSDREMEVLKEICSGKTTHEIASSLFISERTVEKHRAAILLKTKTRNTVEAVIFGIRNGLVKM